MKKSFIVINMAFALLAMSSCTQESNFDIETQSADLPAQLSCNAEIKALTDGITELKVEMFGQPRQTRIITPMESHDIVKIIDAVMAGRGCTRGLERLTVLTSSWASYWAVRTLVNQFPPQNVPNLLSNTNQIAGKRSNPSHLVVSKAITPSTADSIGFFHNFIITKACRIYNDSLQSSTNQNLGVIFADLLNQELGYTYTSSELSVAQSDIEAAASLLIRSVSYDDALVNLKGEFTEDSAKITMLDNFLDGLSQASTPSAKEQYTRSVLKMIDAQLIDLPMKLSLKASVNTAYCSSEFWQEDTTTVNPVIVPLDTTLTSMVYLDSLGTIIGRMHNECMDSIIGNRVPMSQLGNYLYGYSNNRYFVEDSVGAQVAFLNEFDELLTGEEIELEDIDYPQTWNTHIQNIFSTIENGSTNKAAMNAQFNTIQQGILNDSNLDDIGKVALVGITKVANATYNYNVVDKNVVLKNHAAKSIAKADATGALTGIASGAASGRYAGALVFGPGGVVLSVASDAFLGAACSSGAVVLAKLWNWLF